MVTAGLVVLICCILVIGSVFMVVPFWESYERNGERKGALKCCPSSLAAPEMKFCRDTNYSIIVPAGPEGLVKSQ